jgi:hypothetical protein
MSLAVEPVPGGGGAGVEAVADRIAAAAIPATPTPIMKSLPALERLTVMYSDSSLSCRTCSSLAPVELPEPPHADFHSKCFVPKGREEFQQFSGGFRKTPHRMS